jgi:SH3 domain-containing YSC84-like protein 1
MKLDRRTVLAGTAAALALPALTVHPARADAKRQSLVDSALATARKVLGGKDFPDAARMMPSSKGVLIFPELV